MILLFYSVVGNIQWRGDWDMELQIFAFIC